MSQSEYIEYPTPHIDSSFGAEYDPYPTNRPGRPSWNPASFLPPPTSPSRFTPHVTSPVPTVHRLTRGDDGDIVHTPIAPTSPGAMPGASRFRETDQVEPTRWTQPTNVSYPATHGPSWITNPGPVPSIRTADGASLFQPLQASTPAPSRYGDRNYHDAPQLPRYGDRSYLDAPQQPRYGDPYQPLMRYGAAVSDDDDLHHSSAEQRYEHHVEEVDHVYMSPREGERGYLPQRDSAYEYVPPREVDEVEFEAEMRSNSQSEEDDSDPWEEEMIPKDASDPAAQQDMPGMLPEQSEPSVRSKQSKPKKRFVGGFMSGLRSFAGFGHKAPSYPPSFPQPVPAPAPANTLRRPSLARSQPAQHNMANVRQQPPELSPSHPDQSLSTARSQSPLTPEQSEFPVTIPDITEDGPLPNPYGTHEQQIILPVRTETPQAVDIQPTTDYDAMTDPIADEVQEVTLGSHINRVGKFITDLAHLPWMAPNHIAAEYAPAESRRARLPGPKTSVSWYTKENHEKLDLLATPTQPRQRRPTNGSTRQQMPQRQQPRPVRRTNTPLSLSGETDNSYDAATAARPTRTPANAATSAGITPSSPGLSSPGNGQQSQSMAYNYYYASPQPLYVYPSSVSPQSRGRSGSDSQGGAATAMTMPIPMPYPMQLPNMNMPGGSGAQQAVPVFMLAAPAPLVLPNRAHRKRSGHKHAASPSGDPIPPVPSMPIPQTATTGSPGQQQRSPARHATRSPNGHAHAHGHRSPATNTRSPAAARSPAMPRSPAGGSAQPP
ncbi:hypothetical protein BDW22DRAFT_1268759 [Trametopsis cervina]|nr:hypothetical protein BDW22DRAFT_1268759 [Trametopsis cervina]